MTGKQRVTLEGQNNKNKNKMLEEDKEERPKRWLEEDMGNCFWNQAFQQKKSKHRN